MQIIMSGNLSLTAQAVFCMKEYRKTKLEIEWNQADDKLHGKEYFI